MKTEEKQIYILTSNKLIKPKFENNLKNKKNLNSPIIKNYVLLTDTKIMF